MGTISHWAVDDEELEQPAEFEIVEPHGILYSSLCNIDYNCGEITSQEFSIEVLMEALEEYEELAGSLDHVVVKMIESYNYTEEQVDELLVLTDEEDATSGIVVAPRRDEHINFPDDYTSLSEKGRSRTN